MIEERSCHKCTQNLDVCENCEDWDMYEDSKMETKN